MTWISTITAVAKNPTVWKTARRVAPDVVLPVARKGYGAAVSRWSSRKNALQLARQIRGQYSEGTVVAGRQRYVVWKEGKPVDCFPPLTGADLNGGPLAERIELQDLDPALLKDPPPV
jgi:hypothetical protein